MTKIILEEKPIKMPPENGKKSASARQGNPTENAAMATIAGIKSKASVSGIAAVSPSITPITPPRLEAGVSGVAGAWNDLETITGLWSINQDKNSWMWVSGAVNGWKKLSNISESGIVALNMLASHAKQTGSIVNYRDEADGMVHEMYVW